MKYAVITANPNSNALGEIVSEHRTLKGAAKAFGRLRYNRWSYVAEKRADGSYPRRIEALDLPAHLDAMNMPEAH